jgi:hypothetical protein
VDNIVKQADFSIGYKPMYLVGINEAGNAVLITFRYKLDPVPVIQLVQKTIDLDCKLKTTFSDIAIEHTDKYINGGVPGFSGFSRDLPMFTYTREDLSLKFTFNDVGMSCVILPDTAMPFISIIAKL